MARLKSSEKYAKNPFAQQAIIHTVTGTRMIYSNPTGDNDRFAAVNTNTGEDVGDLQFGRRIKVDKTHFLRFYAEGVRMFLGLKSPGIKVFMIIYQLLLDDPNYQQDKIDLTYSLLNEDIKASISRTTFTRGVKELRNVHFLAPQCMTGSTGLTSIMSSRGIGSRLLTSTFWKETKKKASTYQTPLPNRKPQKNNLENQQPHLSDQESVGTFFGPLWPKP